MDKILRVMAVGSIIIGAIAGAMNGGIGGLLTLTIAVAIGSVPLFALAQVLENQDMIIYRLTRLEKPERSRLNPELKVTCNKCGHKYDADMAYCSYCGQREE